MQFTLRQSPDVVQLIRQCYQNKQPVPDHLVDVPELYPWLTGIWEDFYELGTERRDGSMIPWSKIHLYAMVNGYNSRDEFERFHYLIRQMDEAYIQVENEKAKKNADKRKWAAEQREKKLGAKDGRTSVRTNALGDG